MNHKQPKTKWVWIAIDTTQAHEPTIEVTDTSTEMGKIYGITGNSVREAVCRGRDGAVSGRRFEHIQIAETDEDDELLDKIYNYNTETLPCQ